MTMRLSNSSFTGTARTDVAVGSSSEASMFFATAADGPRRVTCSGPVLASPAGSAFFAGVSLAAGAACFASWAGALAAGAAAGFAAGAGACAGAVSRDGAVGVTAAPAAASPAGAEVAGAPGL